jgi:hypothetical protein
MMQQKIWPAKIIISLKFNSQRMVFPEYGFFLFIVINPMII